MPRLITVVLCALLLPSLAAAEVVRLRIERREVVLSGKAFGAAGAYEKLVGKVDFALDPTLPQNRGIVDLALAPRNARGVVEFSADFYLLKPVDPARGNGRLFYEAGNRGTKRILQHVPECRERRRSRDRGGVRRRRADAAGLHAALDGMAVGRAAGPHADGDPDRDATTAARSPGWVRGNFIPGSARDHRVVADRGHTPYPVVDPASAEHRMIVRTLPTDPPHVIPRSRWRFTGPGTVTLDGGFEAGRIYDVVYRARDPRVVGCGLAGTRDLVSFFKHADAARGQPDARHSLRDRLGRVADRPLPPALRLRGIQRGRTRRGRCSTVSSIRWAAPAVDRSTIASASSRATSCSTSTSSIPSTCFRSPTRTQTRSRNGRDRRRCSREPRRATRCPKFFHLLTNSEYFNRAGSLVHTDRDGHARHASRRPPAGSTSSPRLRTSSERFHRRRFRIRTSSGQADMNPLVYAPVIRALFRALDAWVTRGAEPPPSRYPTLADGTLTDRSRLGMAERFRRSRVPSTR